MSTTAADGLPRRIEFLMCGSPNDAFYSQAAIYRLFLDSFGGIYRDARLVLCLADHEQKPLPARWQPWFTRIDVQWATLESFLAHGDGTDHIFTLLDPQADISIICDADTLLLRPLPEAWLREMMASPAIGAAIAHYRPSPDDSFGHDYSALDNDSFWNALATHTLGAAVPLEHAYTLMPGGQRCPFYINYGFLAGPPSLLRALHRELDYTQPKVREFLDNDFYAQIALAMAIERGKLSARALPLRFNYPNDPLADEKYPDELAQVHVVHYLRKTHFDRHRIFTNAEEFQHFLGLTLQGSNAVFQGCIRALTGGRYPFT